MAASGSRRVFYLALLVALALGFAAGWYARIWTEPTPEAKARDAAEQIKSRVHELTH